MTLFQQVFLEIHDSQKIPPKVLSLICRIKKRHVIILFLKSITTGQPSKNNFNLGFIHLDNDI